MCLSRVSRAVDEGRRKDSLTVNAAEGGPAFSLAGSWRLRSVTIASTSLRYLTIVGKIRRFPLCHLQGHSSEGMILFWVQILVLASLLFCTLWFPVIWAGFGIAGRVASLGLWLIKQDQSR